MGGRQPCNRSDTGAERAFEPFFTTKEVGKGTGLGLSLSQVFGFARASGGTASIESEPGKGTTVSLLLPRCSPPADCGTSRAPAGVEGNLEGQRVLLVEDDAHLNELITGMLEEHGAQVTRASSAAEGLECFERTEVDAVLSDMVMPGEMNGLELARRSANGATMFWWS